MFFVNEKKYQMMSKAKNTVIMIPARLGSTRLPNKPLADIQGKPMILHVLERGLEADLGPVVVACCHEEVAFLVRAHGGQAVLTDPDLPSGSDRVYAALEQFDGGQQKYEFIVNLQGDIPFIRPDSLRVVMDPLKNNSEVDIATLATPIMGAEDVANPNIVKIAMEFSSDPQIAQALYFSRQPVPHQAPRYFHHIGVYAYRRAALRRFVGAPPSQLEQIERLEQLRALSLGLRIDVALINEVPQSVDTPEDLAHFSRY
jgi:3-deoxy-manno-octulosonate cytidylyltransferase (CMP-KDO synthetase)